MRGSDRLSVKISLKAARVNANLTLLDAAKKLGIGKDTLSKWEKNPARIQLRYQKVISEVYKMPIDDIFFGI
jgi:DNA-binding XRE family transcriptional regulator